jgi:hypothetical protein
VKYPGTIRRLIYSWKNEIKNRMKKNIIQKNPYIPKRYA